MTNVLDVTRRLPRVFARVLALAGLSLAAVAADVSSAAAQPNMGEMGQMFNDPALANYRLTSDNLAKFIEAVDALKELEDKEFELEDQLNMDDPENMNIGNIAQALDSEPRIKGAINGAGLSSRDFVTFMFAMMQAMFGSIAVQMGGEEALADMPAGALKDNIRFFMEHQEEFEALDDDEDEDN